MGSKHVDKKTRGNLIGPQVRMHQTIRVTKTTKKKKQQPKPEKLLKSAAALLLMIGKLFLSEAFEKG